LIESIDLKGIINAILRADPKRGIRFKTINTKKPAVAGFLLNILNVRYPCSF
jgi:hypothetical protein